MNTTINSQNMDKQAIINNNLYAEIFLAVIYNLILILDQYKLNIITFLQIMIKKKLGDVEPVIIYNNEKIFYPGTSKPNYFGFAINVDKESTLRNQFFPIQSADQAKYIPSSNSDLYVNPINFKNTSENLEENLLFRKPKFSQFNPNSYLNIGNLLFNNSTRVQLKNLK